MKALGLAFAALLASMGVLAPLTLAQAHQAAPEGYGRLLSEVYGGILTALSRTPSGAPQHAELEKALSYVKEAMALYGQGNYTGSLEYFELAMAESSGAISSSGGRVPPGLNASREAALEYAMDLMAELSGVSNSTLKSYVTGLIKQALQLLSEAPSNQSQAAHDLAQARKLLGEANAALQRGPKEALAKGLLKRELKWALGKGQEEGAVLSAIVNMSAYALSAYQAPNSYILLNGTLVAGFVGVYGGQTYAVLAFPLYYISIGGSNYSISSIEASPPLFAHGHGRAALRMERVLEGGEGFVAYLGQQPSGYVSRMSGSLIIVFTPSGGGHAIALLDLGNLSSQPSGPAYIYYQRTGSYSASIDEEIGMGLEALERASWPAPASSVEVNIANGCVNVTWTFPNGETYELSLS